MSNINEKSAVKMTGYIKDTIHHLDSGEVEVREGHNLVVTSFTKLVMALLGRTTGQKGASYWAVGSGSSTWDDNPVQPILSETKLTSELGRKEIPADAFAFLDADGNKVSEPTNRLQITLSFGSADCNGEWREFGIFGGDATSAMNTGIMINKRHHAVLTKTQDMVVERVMIFTLTLA